MKKIPSICWAIIHSRRWLGAVVSCWTLGCSATSHPVVPSPLGQSHAMADLEAAIDMPGTLTVTTVNSADWGVDLSGLLNLDHPKAKAAGLLDRIEPIAVYFHAVKHPVRGLFLVDSGVEHKLGANPSNSAVSWLVRSAMHLERLKVQMDLGTYVAQQKQPVQGVFLTHLHLDHVAGLPDLREDVPVYVGRGDAEDRAFINLFARSTINAELNGKGPLREFIFARDTDVLDVFGDGQFWAIAVPGHTKGSVAYVARTPEGPVLMTGDASHTAWGWNNGVEPGSFSSDKPASAASLDKLRALSERHPKMKVRLGHQPLP